ncbi:MAG: PilZ domain-containing protein [Desulfuromonadaceae bacterium]
MSTRKFSRVRFNVGATIGSAGRQFPGAVENLSMAGMFVVTAAQFVEGDAVDITIVLADTLPEIAMHSSGIVTRITGDGIGIAFEKMDLDSYMHLKNIVAYNSDDAEKIMEEVSHSIDEKFASEK